MLAKVAHIFHPKK